MVNPSPLISIFHSFLLLPLSCPKLQSPSLSSPTPQVFLFPFAILLHLPKTSSPFHLFAYHHVHPFLSISLLLSLLSFYLPCIPSFLFLIPLPFPSHPSFHIPTPAHVLAPLPHFPLKLLPIQPIYSYSSLFFCPPSSPSSSPIHLLPSPSHSSVHPPSF